VSSPRPIPRGRGFRKGPDAPVDQREGDLQRQATSTSRQGWIFPGVSGRFLSGEYSAGTPSTHESLQLGVIGYWDHDIVLHEARIWVVIAGAASYHHMAIYRWNLEKRMIIKVPGTEVIFDTGTTLQRTAAVNDVMLHADQFYFLAHLNLNDKINCPSLASWNNTVRFMVPTRVLADQTEMRGEYPIGIFTHGSLSDLIYGQYFSPEALVVL